MTAFTFSLEQVIFFGEIERHADELWDWIYYSGWKLNLQMYHKFVMEDQHEVDVRSGVVDVGLYIQFNLLLIYLNVELFMLFNR